MVLWLLLKRWFGVNILWWKIKRKATKQYTGDWLNELMPGDVLLYRTSRKALLPTLIMKFTKSPYSHAEIYVGDGWSVSAEWYGITYKNLVGKGRVFVDVLRHNGVGVPTAVVAEYARRSVGAPYDYFHLLSFPWLTRLGAILRSADKAFICSEHVGWCYKKAGIMLRPSVSALLAPVDIAYSKKLDYMFSIYGNQVLKTTFMQFHPFQGDKWNRIGKWIIRTAKVVSARAAFYSKLHQDYRNSEITIANGEYVKALSLGYLDQNTLGGSHEDSEER